MDQQRHSVFLSIVLVLSDDRSFSQLLKRLSDIHAYVENHFQDYEYILVNNSSNSIDPSLSIDLNEAIKQNTFILNLSNPVHFNNAVLAGFDRSNGDYTIILEDHFIENPSIIGALYDKSKEGNDVVYLKGNRKKLGPLSKFINRQFFKIIAKHSKLELDSYAHNTRIISRRALNSLLKLRENVRFMKALYAVVGYPSAYIEVEETVHHTDRTVREQFRTSLIAITSFSNFLRSLMLRIFLLSIGILVLVTINTLLVKFTNYDIFGDYHEAVPGWAFLVILSSIFFAITCLNLYIISIYLSNIYEEIKKRPLYIIKSAIRI